MIASTISHSSSLTLPSIHSYAPLLLHTAYHPHTHSSDHTSTRKQLSTPDDLRVPVSCRYRSSRRLAVRVLDEALFPVIAFLDCSSVVSITLSFRLTLDSLTYLLLALGLTTSHLHNASSRLLSVALNLQLTLAPPCRPALRRNALFQRSLSLIVFVRGPGSCLSSILFCLLYDLVPRPTCLPKLTLTTQVARGFSLSNLNPPPFLHSTNGRP